MIRYVEGHHYSEYDSDKGKKVSICCLLQEVKLTPLEVSHCHKYHQGVYI